MALTLNAHPTHRPAPWSTSHACTGGRTWFSFLIKHSEIVVHPSARIRRNTESLCPLTSCPQQQHLPSCRLAHSQNGDRDTVQTRAFCTQGFLPPLPFQAPQPLATTYPLQGAHTCHTAGSLWGGTITRPDSLQRCRVAVPTLPSFCLSVVVDLAVSVT